MKLNFWLKLCSVSVVGFLILFTFPECGVPQTQDATGFTQPVEYVIEDIQGPTVRVLEEGETQWEPAEEGQVVDAGDEIRVGDNSEATLTMESDTSVHLNENSDMKVEQIQANTTGGFLSRLQVLAGLILADVKKNLTDSHSTFEVESNGVVCGVRGTAFEVNAQDGDSQVSTHEGKVEVSGNGESHMVTAGNFSSFKKGRFSMQRRLDQSEIQRFQRWRAFRQTVFQKRLRRLNDILHHKRQVWKRRHPHPGHPAFKKELEKKNIKKKLKRKQFRKS